MTTSAEKTAPPLADDQDILERLFRLHETHRAMLLELVEREMLRAAGPGRDGAPLDLVDVPNPHPHPEQATRIKRNIREHPLAMMAARKQISGECLAAGMRLLKDIEASMISPATGIDLARLAERMTVTSGPSARRPRVEDPATGRMVTAPEPLFAPTVRRQKGAPVDIAGVRLDAMHRVNRARERVTAEAGLAAAEVVFLVVGDGHALADIVRKGRHGARQKVGRLLQDGLYVLAVYYGFVLTGPDRDRGRRVLAGERSEWGRGGEERAT